MVCIQLNDLFCECDNKYGLGQLDVKTGLYTCYRCGCVLNEKISQTTEVFDQECDKIKESL